MDDGLLGQLMLFAGDFTPQHWMPCEGQVLPIQQYMALFSLLGNQFGGDGRTHFRLPDLRSTVPISAGQGTGLPHDYKPGTAHYLDAQPTDGEPTVPYARLRYCICVHGLYPSRA